MTILFICRQRGLRISTATASITLMWRQHGHVVGCDRSVGRRTTALPPFLVRTLPDPRLLLSTVLLASTARWAATEPLRKEWTQATQQKQVNELYQREQLEHLTRAQELNQTQRQLDQLRQQEANRPGVAAQPRAQQLHETQKQLDQLKLEQQLNRVQHELKLNEIAREQHPFRRQEQIRELQLQQHMQFLQDQSRTKLMQQNLNR